MGIVGNVPNLVVHRTQCPLELVSHKLQGYTTSQCVLLGEQRFKVNGHELCDEVDKLNLSPRFQHFERCSHNSQFREIVSKFINLGRHLLSYGNCIHTTDYLVLNSILHRLVVLLFGLFLCSCHIATAPLKEIN